MKEELTTAMHSEFVVSHSVDKQNMAFTALSVLNGNIHSVDSNWACDVYNVTLNDLKNNLDQWKSMNKATEKAKKDGKY